MLQPSLFLPSTNRFTINPRKSVMKRIDILYFDVTSGHRTSAFALKKALHMQGEPVQVRAVNFTDILALHSGLYQLARTGIGVFNWGVRHERAYFARQQVGLFQAIQSRIPPSIIQQIARFWDHHQPDAVVSVMPICNLMLERALHTIYPDCPYVVMPNDYEESMRNYWFDLRMDAYYINPTPKLNQQAAALGIPFERRFEVSGMPIDPLFYDPPPADKAAALREQGLDPGQPTVLVGFGGQGSIFVKRCAEELCTVRTPINVIFLCGRYTALYDQLSAFTTPYRKLVLSFLPEAPAYYYHLADVIIGKPGSMTITEAIVTHSALLAIESQSLALVQRGNEAWLRHSGIGAVIRLPELAGAVEHILQSTTANSSLEREWHRGVFEIADTIVQMAHGRGLHREVSCENAAD
jgi:processive 1,2-diacylglycerol beta-glucosyltransferase